MKGDFPEGWVESTIGALGNYVNGRGFKKSEWRANGLPIIRIQNLNDPEAKYNYSDAEHEEKYAVKNGDLLISWAASLGVYLWEGGPAWLNQHIFRVEVDERVVTKQYLYWALKNAISELEKKAHGSGMVHITKGRFESQPINLAPKNQQTKIVSKIDELFSQIDEGERALERVQMLIERYRQSVLKAAVTGELTRDWREKHQGQYESGEELLQRILTARREAWEQAELEKMAARGEPPSSTSWKQRYKEPTRPVSSNLPMLPIGWVWVSLPLLCGESAANGISVKGTDSPPGTPALRLDSFQPPGFDFSRRRYISITEQQAERLAIREGDFFVSRANGSRSLVGRAAIASRPPVCTVFPDTMIRFRPVNEPNIREWLSLIWSSRLVRDQIEMRAKTTAGIYKISQADISEIAIPLPPVHEQDIATSVAAKLNAQATHLAETAETGRASSGALRQTILKKAFAGTLTSNDVTVVGGAA